MNKSINGYMCIYVICASLYISIHARVCVCVGAICTYCLVHLYTMILDTIA